MRRARHLACQSLGVALGVLLLAGGSLAAPATGPADTTKAPAAKPGSGKPTPSKPTPAKPALSAPESAKTESAKTESAKTESAKTEPAKTEPAKTEPAKTEPAKPGPASAPPTKPAGPPSAPDEDLARLVRSTARMLAAAPAPGSEDLAVAVLISLARSSVVSALHGHFALAGLGQSVRSGGMAASDVAVMAQTMSSNYRGLAEAYAMLAGQKSFDPQLANLFRSVQVLSQRAQLASDALTTYAAAPNEGQRVKAFEDALEDYRGRVQALFAQLEQGSKDP